MRPHKIVLALAAFAALSLSLAPAATAQPIQPNDSLAAGSLVGGVPAAAPDYWQWD